MKIINVSILSIISFLFTASNIYSQTEELNKSLRNNIHEPLHDVEIGIYKNVLEKDGFENYANQILKRVDFDSTSIIDSVIVTKEDGNKYKYTYNYDSNGNIILFLIEKLGGSQWVDVKYTSYIYNSNGMMIQRYSKYWNGTSFYNFQKSSYNYDSIRNLILYLYEFSSNDSIWVLSTRETNSYDLNNNISLSSYEDWGYDDSGNYGLISHHRQAYKYDSYGNIISKLEDNWYDNEWVPTMRNTFLYDLKNNRISWLVEFWNGSEFYNSERYNFAYDLSGNMTSEIVEEWNNNTWNNYYQHNYTYDLSGNMVSSLQKKGVDSNWVNDVRFTSGYDANKNRTSLHYENWEEGIWVNIWIETFTYNSSGDKTLYLFEKWLENNWVEDVRLQYTYMYDSMGNMTSGLTEILENGSWVAYNDVFYIYDSFGRRLGYYGSEINVFYSPITNVEEREFSVSDYYLSQNYPNPFNPSTTLSYSIPVVGMVELKVYDVLGREVATLVNKQQQAGSYEVQFTSNNYQLTSGVYFYRLKTTPSDGQGFVESRKMVLLK